MGNVRIAFTQQSLDELNEIYAYSAKQWGKRTADKYFAEIQSAIERIEEYPNLLASIPDFHDALRFYTVNKHLLICDVADASIVVLTVTSTYRDIPKLLARIQPQLVQEVAVLHRQLRHSKRKK